MLTSIVETIIDVGTVVTFNAYGPQENDSTGTKVKFWRTLEEEIMKAKSLNKMIILQMDATTNGKFLIDLVKRQRLTICNGSDVSDMPL